MCRRWFCPRWPVAWAAKCTGSKRPSPGPRSAHQRTWPEDCSPEIQIETLMQIRLIPSNLIAISDCLFEIQIEVQIPSNLKGKLFCNRGLLTGKGSIVWGSYQSGIKGYSMWNVRCTQVDKLGDGFPGFKICKFSYFHTLLASSPTPHISVEDSTLYEFRFMVIIMIKSVIKSLEIFDV